MIIKEKNPITESIHELEYLLTTPHISEYQKKQIKNEITSIKRGFKGEKDCAFFIDGFVKDHPNRVIIHDLRIEDNGDVAQIDHLFINRNLQMFVLESKNYSYGLRISDNGEFEYWNGKTYCGMASPIEQAIRQVEILKRYITNNDILPKRLGFTLKPEIDFYILCGTQSRIVRPKKENKESKKVLKVDLFKKQYDHESRNQSFSSGLKGAMNIVTKETLIDIAQKITAGHVPLNKNYRAQFGIKKDENQNSIIIPTTTSGSNPAPKQNEPPRNTEIPRCPRCGNEMVLRTAKKGTNSGNSFWGCSSFPKCRCIINIDHNKNR